MAAHLAPCPGCSRHVRVDSVACPFCLVELDGSFRSQGARPQPTTRLGRAALMAFGAALAGSTGCYQHHLLGDRPPDSGPSVDARFDGGSPIPLYGAAVPDGGPDAPTTVSPAYGGPVPIPVDPIDAGPDAPGGSVALYGGPTPVPIEVDAGGNVNLYGAPPLRDDAGPHET
jgi:hypothetical protein